MRRLNVKLTLWLVGITLVSVVGVHLLHGVQIEKNADFLKVQAEKAQEAGNVKEAIKQYNQYLKHRDDPDGYAALAELVAKVADDKSATRQEKMRAYGILQEAIRRHPDLKSVRRRLVDYTMLMRRWQESIEHIQQLRENGVTDSELDLKEATCFYFNGDESNSLKAVSVLIGYDPQTNQFQAQAPPGAKEVGGFELLSQLLRRKTDGGKLAEAVMVQLVTWNPDSVKAHLTRASFLANTVNLLAAKLDSANSPESADFLAAKADTKAEIDRALALAPDDADAILAAASYAMSEFNFISRNASQALAEAAVASSPDVATAARDRAEQDKQRGAEELAKAEELLGRALEKFPQRQDVYLRSTELALMRTNPKQAIEKLELGLKQAEENGAILERLIDLQFQQGNLEGARDTLAKMVEHDPPFAPELLRYQEARMKFASGEFLEASRSLEGLRSAMVRFSGGGYLSQLEVMLARCYEVLGQADRQLEAYRRLANAAVNSLPGRLGQALALQALGRYEEASDELPVLLANIERITFIQPAVMQLCITDQLRKKEDERDWRDVEKIAALIMQQKDRKELDNELLKADVLMLRGQLKEAGDILNEQRRKYPEDARVWSGLIRNIRQRSPERVSQLLDMAAKQLGDTAPMRAERVRTAVLSGGDQAVATLQKLEQGLDKFKDNERSGLYVQLGAAYSQLRDYADVKRCWRLALKLDPKNANLWQYTFDLAMDNKDEEGMRDIVKELRSLHYFGVDSSLYKYCAASVLLFPLNAKYQTKRVPLSDVDKATVSQARKLIDEAVLQRAEWSPLWRVRAEMEQFEGNPAGAITNYQRAIDYNRLAGPTLGRRLVQLLYMTSRFTEANAALQYLGDDSNLSDTWTRTIQDIKFRAGGENAPQALEQARKTAEADPENAYSQIFYAQMLMKSGLPEEAEKAYRQGVKAGPKMPETWDALVRHLMSLRQQADAVAVVRDAAKQLADNPVVVAMLFDRVNEKEQAESFFKQALESKPDDLLTIRRVADYYFTSNKPDESQRYLDELIAKAPKSGEKDAIRHLGWARRAKAQIIASSNQYQDVMEATKLVEQNAKNGELAQEDMVVVISLLKDRPEYDSRARAVELLEELRKQRTLTPREQVALGQLYSGLGKWPQARELMLGAIARQGDDIPILVAFSERLLINGEYEDAGRWIEQADELIAKSVVALPGNLVQTNRILKAQWLMKTNKVDDAVRLLESLVPRPLPPTQLSQLEIVGRQLELLGQFDAAEKLYNEYMASDQRGTIAVAAYMGRRGEIEKSFKLLADSRKSQPAYEILATAMQVLRSHPEKVSKEQLDALEQWAAEALPEQTGFEAVRIHLLMAELCDFQGDYAQAEKIYRELLAGSEAVEGQKAHARNNLAFILAIKRDRPESATESLKLTEEAVKVYGPTHELLDTRALAYLAQGKTKQAVADMQKSLIDHPEPVKYFHLAQVEMAAQNLEAARGAMSKAQESGLDPNQLTPLERKTYTQLAAELK